jgi:hypothetical protein
LPQLKNSPTIFKQGQFTIDVTLPISNEFLPPVLDVSFWNGGKTAPLMLMPKATVYKYT